MLAQVSSMCKSRNVLSGEKEKVRRTCETEQVEEDKQAGNGVQSEERRLVDSPEHSHPRTLTRHTSNLRAGDSFSSSNALNGQLEQIKIPVSLCPR